MQFEERQMSLWKAGEIAPAGTYVRVDDCSYRAVTLEQAGPLPATFDGHVALYYPAPFALIRHAHHEPTSAASVQRG